MYARPWRPCLSHTFFDRRQSQTVEKLFFAHIPLSESKLTTTGLGTRMAKALQGSKVVWWRHLMLFHMRHQWTHLSVEQVSKNENNDRHKRGALFPLECGLWNYYSTHSREPIHLPIPNQQKTCMVTTASSSSGLS